jgi:hypothetical protein
MKRRMLRQSAALRIGTAHMPSKKANPQADEALKMDLCRLQKKVPPVVPAEPRLNLCPAQ